MANPSREGEPFDHSYIGVWRAVREIETGIRPTLAEGFAAYEKACKHVRLPPLRMSEDGTFTFDPRPSCR